jgi:hypothetical protein
LAIELIQNEEDLCGLVRIHSLEQWLDGEANQNNQRVAAFAGQLIVFPGVCHLLRQKLLNVPFQAGLRILVIIVTPV